LWYLEQQPGGAWYVSFNVIIIRADRIDLISRKRKKATDSGVDVLKDRSN